MSTTEQLIDAIHFKPSEEVLKFFATKKTSAEVRQRLTDLRTEQVSYLHLMLVHALAFIYYTNILIEIV